MTTSTLTLWTLVLAGAIVLVLAVYLTAIALNLLRASRHLEQLAGGLIQVRDNAKPLESKLTTIAGALSALNTEFSAVDRNLSQTATALRDS